MLTYVCTYISTYTHTYFYSKKSITSSQRRENAPYLIKSKEGQKKRKKNIKVDQRDPQ